MSRVGFYDNLNQADPVSITLDLDKLADLIESRNYGTQRFLSALVRVRSRYPNKFGGAPDKLREGLEEMLERGLW